MAPITQPITVSIFGNANRQPGTYFTNTAPIPEGVDAIGIRDNMTEAVASDPANSFLLTIEVSPDGVIWRGVHREEWQGGTFINKFTQISQARHIDNVWADSELRSGAWTGWLARAVLIQDVQLRVGFDLTVYPKPVS